ncbi:MAG: endolytic transglycosylase MltG [Elusimicrobia bacterium]|nr:endolytic transglycosylase MltG [Elusimicrobiota bacterium]
MTRALPIAAPAVVAGAMVLLAGAAPASQAAQASHAPQAGEDEVEVAIPPGLSATAASRLLEEKGVVGSGFLFRLAAKVTGSERSLKPGGYRFKRGTPVFEALKALKAGTVNDVRVVIPEGFSARQIAERLEANSLCKAAEFMELARSRRLEGFLFPTTYDFDRRWGAPQIAQRMHDEFKRRVAPMVEAARGKPDLDLQQVVTLASIVEREAAIQSEKPMIAAVYLNRLRRRKKLEADPTVQYALGYWKKGLTLDDLRVASPYNTYTHFGLPPGPICSPGAASVAAVLDPAKTDALYFVADAKGGHVFNAALDEHLKAKQRFKHELRLQKAAARRGER